MAVSSRSRRCADIARLSTSHGMIWGAGIKAFPDSVNRKQNQEKTSISRGREARLVIGENKYKCSHFHLHGLCRGRETNTNTHALTVALELTRKRQPHQLAMGQGVPHKPTGHVVLSQAAEATNSCRKITFIHLTRCEMGNLKQQRGLP